jgi:hypothetical protein
MGEQDWKWKGDDYWTKEQPVEVMTRRLWFSYYPKAGKLQIAAIFVKGGQIFRAKVVTLDQEDVALYPEARELLVRVLEDWT